jgi:hypothetical protein
LLPGLYDDCGQALGGSRQHHEKTSGGSVPSMPFNAAAAEARSAIVGTLGCWAGMVATERRVEAPQRLVPDLARFLRCHIDWLAAHVAAGEFSDEMANLVRMARRAAYPTVVRRMRVGGCVESDCGGQLVATLRPYEPLAAAEIRCDVDPAHQWADHEWLELNRRIGHRPAGAAADTPTPGGCEVARWLSAADIARLWRVAAGSVYRLASEQRWRRRTCAGRTSYHEADVAHTFERRTRRQPPSQPDLAR